MKLDIISKYAAAYSRIMASQKYRFRYVYVDAFSGSGIQFSKSSGTFVSGSPLKALEVSPPFHEYHFIDLDAEKISALRQRTAQHQGVFVYEGDCNRVLIDEVFPRIQYEAFQRGLCLLDPYGLHLDWEVLAAAGHARSLEVFLNFPVADMNRNVLLHNPDKVDPRQIARMNAFWGDDSWRLAAYDSTQNLFGWEEKANNDAVVEAFRKRLREVAGFQHVTEPIPMRNSRNAVVYYLFFASQKPVAAHIVKEIFDKYRDRRVQDGT